MTSQEMRAKVAAAGGHSLEPSYCVACKMPTCLYVGLIAKKYVTFQDFFLLQAEWSRAVFGNDAERGPQGPLKHLAKEVTEALEKPADIFEYADLQFLVFDATRRAGFRYDQLLETCFKKLQENRDREWGDASATEPVEHVRARTDATRTTSG